MVKRETPQRMEDVTVDPFTRSVSGGSFELESFIDPGGVYV